MKIKSGSASALYVHIPFCTHICAYCDFPKMIYNSSWVFPYLDALKKEIALRKIEKVETVYIGGGTPSSLTLDEINELLIILKPYIDLAKEVTFEANVENLDKEKLLLLVKSGITRISLGVQSFNDETLKRCNRHHSGAAAIDTIKLIKDTGFKNFSIDLIYGLPGQSVADFMADLHVAVKLNIPHISFYSLSVNPGTRFYLDKIPEPNEDISLAFYRQGLNYLRQLGYTRYEVSNFARPGYESQHNQIYWHNQPYYGVGLGAAGYLNHFHYRNTLNLHKYLLGEYEFESEKENTNDLIEYFLLTNLRCEKGFAPTDFLKATGKDFFVICAKPLEKLKKLNLLCVSSENVRATDLGFEKLDRIILELISTF